jgi:uncharacterized membrane protein
MDPSGENIPAATKIIANIADDMVIDYVTTRNFAIIMTTLLCISIMFALHYAMLCYRKVMISGWY